jgi:hypothetical protein
MTFQSRLGTLYATWYSCLWIQIQCGLLLGLIFLTKIGAIVDIEKKMIQICNGLGAIYSTLYCVIRKWGIKHP